MDGWMDIDLLSVAGQMNSQRNYTDYQVGDV